MKSTRLCQLFIIRPQRTVLLMWFLLFLALFCEFHCDGASLFERANFFRFCFWVFFLIFFPGQKFIWREKKNGKQRKKNYAIAKIVVKTELVQIRKFVIYLITNVEGGKTKLSYERIIAYRLISGFTK